MGKSYFIKKFKQSPVKLLAELGGWSLRSMTRLAACLAFLAGYEGTILKRIVRGESSPQNASTGGETNAQGAESSMPRQKQKSEDILEPLMPECNHNYAQCTMKGDILVLRCTKCHRTKGTPIEMVTDAQIAKLGSEFTSALKGACVGQA